MEKINIAEILKDCPSGMELDCAMYEDVYFDYIDELNIIHCYIQHGTYKTSITFNQLGTPNSNMKSKCVIFPKGKTTWEGFQRPFKDGDVVVCEEDGVTLQIFIFKSKTNENRGLCYTGYDFKRNKFFDEGTWYIERLATEEEKEKLFKAIKDNGYRWNAETKILEKLVEPKFKVGDRIKKRGLDDIYAIEIAEVGQKKYVIKNGGFCYIETVDKDYELVSNKFDITILKPFESRVLVRYDKDNKWCGAFFSHIDKEHHTHCYKYVTTAGKSYPYCIPYKGNEHLLNTTYDCDDYYKTWK